MIRIQNKKKCKKILHDAYQIHFDMHSLYLLCLIYTQINFVHAYYGDPSASLSILADESQFRSSLSWFLCIVIVCAFATQFPHLLNSVLFSFSLYNISMDPIRNPSLKSWFSLDGEMLARRKTLLKIIYARIRNIKILIDIFFIFCHIN